MAGADMTQMSEGVSGQEATVPNKGERNQKTEQTQEATANEGAESAAQTEDQSQGKETQKVSKVDEGVSVTQNGVSGEGQVIDAQV
tara:strand:+ start:75 stop:332 length:258 start_codon:yes stop_codon:yes gene_type:complete